MLRSILERNVFRFRGVNERNILLLRCISSYVHRDIKIKYSLLIVFLFVAFFTDYFSFVISVAEKDREKFSTVGNVINYSGRIKKNKERFEIFSTIYDRYNL